MTTADGSLQGLHKIVDHGSAALRWNLVIMGDGYQTHELTKFAADADAFVARLKATPPFNNMWCAINVYRLDVVSTESGADLPAACYGGSARSVATYYDATFCSDFGGRPIDRLLTVDAVRAHDDAVHELPEVDQVLVIVNAEQFGGSGHPLAAVYSSGTHPDVGIHELGHSAFELADEHETGNLPLPATEPAEVNVTKEVVASNLKWRNHVTAGVPVPTECHPGCTGCGGASGAALSGTTVGLFEGARYTHCGMYRPSNRCMMNDYMPFCSVCRNHISSILQRHLPFPSWFWSLFFPTPTP